MPRDLPVRLDGATALCGALLVGQEEVEADVDGEGDDCNDHVDNDRAEDAEVKSKSKLLFFTLLALGSISSMPLFSDGFFPPAWSVLPLVSFGIFNNSPQVFYNFPRFWFAEEVVRFTNLRMF